MMSLPLFPIADRQPIPMRRRAPRKCRSHQRIWKTYCVDNNLEDSWLESLNSLQAFNLISICEGHAASGDRPRRRAHLNLRLKSAYLPKVALNFEAYVDAFRDRIGRTFYDNSCFIDVEFRVHLRPFDRDQCVSHELVVHIKALHAAGAAGMSNETRNWFNAVIPQVISLDQFFCESSSE